MLREGMSLWIPLILTVALLADLPVAAAQTQSLVPVAATEKPAQTCLSDAELRDEVAAGRAIPQAQALRLARGAVSADPVRARLCRRDGVLVYLITALAKDGKVTRLTLDAASGKILSRR